MAEELLQHPELPGPIRQALAEERGAFLLGNTAPDVQVVSGQERQATHFFTLPLDPEVPPPWVRVLEEHPSLAQSGRRDRARAAFIAGYLCHLQADWTWINDIFIPVFGPDNRWASFRQRLYLHNVLRAYLDAQIIPDLPAETAAYLQSAAPESWLPFVEDRHLVVWRDYLSRQLEPGEATRTVEVFAARQGISPAKYYRLLDSEERMDAEIFSRLPRGRLIEYRMQLIEMNLQLLVAYLTGSVQHAPRVSLRQSSVQATSSTDGATQAGPRVSLRQSPSTGPSTGSRQAQDKLSASDKYKGWKDGRMEGWFRQAQPPENGAQPPESEAQPAESEAQPAENEARPPVNGAQPPESEAQPADMDGPFDRSFDGLRTSSG